MNGGDVSTTAGTLRPASSRARRSRASASARRARVRHLLCLSQAAMPPTTTPTPTSTKISMNSGIFSASAGCAESNGSNETVMISRFATANITMMIASGTRMAMATNLRMAKASCPGQATASKASQSDESLDRRALVQPLAHFLAGLEERHGLLRDRDMRAGARVASALRGAVRDRKRAEAAQLDAVAACERGRDLAKDGVDDVLDVALVQVRVLP